MAAWLWAVALSGTLSLAAVSDTVDTARDASFGATTAPAALSLPHDSQLCVSWRIEGGGLPSSSVTRCFDPFEDGPWSTPAAGVSALSPGVHTVEVVAKLRRGGGDVPLARASFTPAFDPAAGVALVLMGCGADGTCTGLGPEMVKPSDTAEDVCAWPVLAAAASLECTAVAAREVSERRAEASAAYGGRREALLYYDSMQSAAYVSADSARAILGGSVAVPADFAALGVSIGQGESEASIAATVCGSLTTALGVPPDAAELRALCETGVRQQVFDLRAGLLQRLRGDRAETTRTSVAAEPRLGAMAYWPEVAALEEYLAALGALWQYEGTTADASPARMLHALLDARPPSAPTRQICEIGVNAGHSSLLWLLAAPNASVLAFDIATHHCVEHAGAWLKRRFPARYSLIAGDSLVSVPAFHAAHPDVICDVWFIDGGHSHSIAAADFAAARAMAAPGALVLFDDVSCGGAWCPGPRGVWLDALRRGEVLAWDGSLGGSAPWVCPDDTAGGCGVPAGAAVPGTSAGYNSAIGTFV